MAMNAAFFDAVRPIFGGNLTQGQVTGISTILDAWDRYGDGSLQKLAYVLATPVIETDRKMQPIHEYGERAYFKKYEPGTKIGKRLGNTQKGDGYKFRGRGLVQLTGRRNYALVGREFVIDLVGNPDLALDPLISARILVVGTIKGWFTGKGLGAYIDDIDEDDDEDLREFIEARRTVNGKDRAKEIGKIALRFEKALKAGIAAAPAPTTPPKPSATAGEAPRAPGGIIGWIILAITAIAAGAAAARDWLSNLIGF